MHPIFSKSCSVMLIFLMVVIIFMCAITYKLAVLMNSKTQFNNNSSDHNKGNTSDEYTVLIDTTSLSTISLGSTKPSTDTTELITKVIKATASLSTVRLSTDELVTATMELCTENVDPIVPLQTSSSVSDSTVNTNTDTISTTELDILSSDNTDSVVIRSITIKEVSTTGGIESATAEDGSTTVDIEPVTAQINPTAAEILHAYLKNVIKKDTWCSVMAKDCPVLLQLPINKIYVSETFTHNCFNYLGCKNIIVTKQKLDMFTSNDIQYNFIIGGDGAIFEGMCWSCKVWPKRVDSTSILVAMTGNSYDLDSKAKFESNKINSEQYEALELLLKANHLIGNISLQYQLLPYSCVNNDKSNPSTEVIKRLEMFENFYSDCTS